MEKKKRRYGRNYINSKNILQTCSKYVKKSGEIVYSTCSILKNENQDIIEEFLKNNKNFHLKKLNCKKINILEENYINLYQNKNNDGFFICKLIKE